MHHCKKRVDGIVASLQLNDPAKEARLKLILTTRSTGGPGFAQCRFCSPDKSVHANLNAGLAAELTPEQIETVKDKLTVNKVPVTFKVYQQIVTDLTPEEEARILWIC